MEKDSLKAKALKLLLSFVIFLIGISVVLYFDLFGVNNNLIVKGKEEGEVDNIKFDLRNGL